MRRRDFVSLLGGGLLAPVALAAEDGGFGLDRQALQAMADRLVASGAKIHAVLVTRRGKLVFERYFTGEDEVPGLLFGRRREFVAFEAETLHDMKSVSKSVASLAFGIAADHGLFPDLTRPILSFFPELSDLRSPERDRIQLAHVLSMTMGLAWEEATAATGDFHNDEARMNMALDPCRFVLSRAVTAPAGQEFFYNTGALRLISTILHRATGRPLADFAREFLFEPLGIKGAVWESVRGETDAGGGLRLRPQDMAKLGQLALQGGRWGERQIVSQAWIETSTARQVKGPEGLDYGYLWWLGRARIGGREFPWIGALGRGGQSIRIVPALDLAVAVTAGYYQDYSPQAFQTQYGVFRDVLRAVPTAG